MSKTTFTRGLWTAESIMSHEKHDICLVNPNKPISETGWPVVIATVYSDNDGRGISKDEANANARLIAAAPDMYSELRDRSNILGGVKILLLQGDIEGAMEILNRYELKFTDGPTMYSEALAKATVAK